MLSISMTGSKFWDTLVFVKTKLKALYAFVFPKSERHCDKLLKCVNGICDVKYFRTVTHEEVASFLKEQVFLN